MLCYNNVKKGALDPRALNNGINKMEAKNNDKFNYKTSQLWSFACEYYFHEYQKEPYYYCGFVCARDIAKFLELPQEERVYKAIYEWSDYYEESLKDDKVFNEFLEDEYADEARTDYFDTL